MVEQMSNDLTTLSRTDESDLRDGIDIGNDTTVEAQGVSHFISHCTIMIGGRQDSISNSMAGIAENRDDDRTFWPFRISFKGIRVVSFDRADRIEISGDYGVLSISAVGAYTYRLFDHAAFGRFESFSVATRGDSGNEVEFELFFGIGYFESDGTGHGTEINDVISGGDRDSNIYAYDGNDTVFGKGHDNTIYAGPGNDLIYGDAGNDTIFADDGSDDIVGGPGENISAGGSGDDYFWTMNLDGITRVLDFSVSVGIRSNYLM